MALWNSPGFLQAEARRLAKAALEPEPAGPRINTKRGRVVRQIVPRRLSRGSTSSESSIDDGDGEGYDVEEVLDERFNRRLRETEYYIKWDGYSASDNTWEPERNLENCSIFQRYAREKDPAWQPSGGGLATLSPSDHIDEENDDLPAAEGTDNDDGDGDDGAEDGDNNTAGEGEDTTTTSELGRTKRRREAPAATSAKTTKRPAKRQKPARELPQVKPLPTTPSKPKATGATSRLYAKLLSGKFGGDNGGSLPKRRSQSPSKSPRLKHKYLAAPTSAASAALSMSPKLASKAQATLDGFIQLEVPETPGGLPVGSISPSKSPVGLRRRLMIVTPQTGGGVRKAGSRLAAALAVDDDDEADEADEAVEPQPPRVVSPLDDEHPLLVGKPGEGNVKLASPEDWLTMAS